MKGHVKAIINVFVILIIYTIAVSNYANNKSHKIAENNAKKKEVTPPPTEEETEYQFNIILGPKTILGYSDGLWEENPTYDYKDKYFDVYTGENGYSNIKIMYDNDWHAMNDDRDFIEWADDFTAINSSIEYQRKNQAYSDINASEAAVITDFLNSKGITFNYDTLNKHVMIEDINKDGIKDAIYVVSNLFLDDYTGYNNTFAFAFARVLNQNLVLFEDTYKTPGALNICNPYVDQIIYIDEKPILILGCGFSSNGGTKHMLYEIEGKTVNKLIESSAN